MSRIIDTLPADVCRELVACWHDGDLDLKMFLDVLRDRFDITGSRDHRESHSDDLMDEVCNLHCPTQPAPPPIAMTGEQPFDGPLNYRLRPRGQNPR